MDIDRRLFSEELDRAVELLADAFAARLVRQALIGGLATSLRGRQRLTQDIDFLVDVPQIELPGLLDDPVGHGFALDPAVVINQYVREHITAFWFGPVRIDWLKPVLPFYVACSSLVNWPHFSLTLPLNCLQLPSICGRFRLGIDCGPALPPAGNHGPLRRPRRPGGLELRPPTDRRPTIAGRSR
jgi:hypothetical protein